MCLGVLDFVLELFDIGSIFQPCARPQTDAQISGS